ncbi:MAG: hypothetical protein ACXVPD_01855 [Bacteroidia bacterium]
MTSAQGSASQKITDIWFYVNGLFKGTYPVGNTLPVDAKGSAKIVFYAGIKNNGISETRQPYEFYAPVETDTTVNSDITVTRDFSFKYKSNTIFHYVEDFESPAMNLKSSPGSDIQQFQMLNNSYDKLEGNYMYFSIDGNDRNGFFESVNQYSLPLDGAPVYMELNYKCNQPFTVGVCNGYDYRSAVTVNGSPGWNKIYIQLSTVVSTPPTYAKYGIFIRALKQKELEKAEFFIDNIKLLSY